MDLPPAAYADRLHAAWVEALVARRQRLGRTPYALALPGHLTAQTVRNIEAGVHSPSLRTLCLLSHQLHWDLRQAAQDAADRLQL